MITQPVITSRHVARHGIVSQAVPATPQKWTCKAIFSVNDQRIGQWSDDISLTIGG